MEFELSEIDFRFADDEDAEDIAVVVSCHIFEKVL
jgi:hypothetical protein